MGRESTRARESLKKSKREINIHTQLHAPPYSSTHTIHSLYTRVTRTCTHAHMYSTVHCSITYASNHATSRTSPPSAPRCGIFASSMVVPLAVDLIREGGREKRSGREVRKEVQPYGKEVSFNVHHARKAQHQHSTRQHQHNTEHSAQITPHHSTALHQHTTPQHRAAHHSTHTTGAPQCAYKTKNNLFTLISFRLSAIDVPLSTPPVSSKDLSRLMPPSAPSAAKTAFSSFSFFSSEAASDAAISFLAKARTLKGKKEEEEGRRRRRRRGRKR